MSDDEDQSVPQPQPVETAQTNAAETNEGNPMGGEAKEGGPHGYSAASFQLIREKWIKDAMQKRISEFTEQRLVRIHTASWNVNAKKPAHQMSGLAEWLIHPDHPPADIYCIGFQEIVDLNAVNLIADHTAVDPWAELISSTLRSPFQLVQTVHLVGLAMLLFVKKELIPYLSDLHAETVGVGIMGVGGNKGAVAIRFRIFDSFVCIINSHLAAHQKNVLGRNNDYANILKRLTFPALDTRHTIGAANMTSPFDHEHLFWIGDLNYRINLDLQTIYSSINQQKWDFLLESDQLMLERAKGNAFQNWKEGRINFAPTYKYASGTDEYDQLKMRLPAWCDRIQWIGDGINQLFYRRAELKASDHKPVCALFDVQMKILVKEKQQRVFAEVVHLLDVWENQALPKVAVAQDTIRFPPITFDTPVTQTVNVSNCGVGAVKFYFATRLEGNAYSAKWLTVDPPTAFLPPKESVDLKLTVHVTRETALALTAGHENLEDVLILRLENGGDSFVTITGTYLKSCFGTTIDFLVQTPGPVREAAKSAQPPARTLSVPKELWRMVDYIYRNGMDEPELFATSGDAAQIERIREALDTGEDFGQYDVHSMADTMVRFLASLAQPVFPAELCAGMPDSANLTPWCLQALVKLPPAQYNTFIYIISFLREVLKHHRRNKVKIDALVYIFAGCLMQWDAAKAAKAQSVRVPPEHKILHHFLSSKEFQ